MSNPKSIAYQSMQQSVISMLISSLVMFIVSASIFTTWMTMSLPYMHTPAISTNLALLFFGVTALSGVFGVYMTARTYKQMKALPPASND